MMLPQHSKTTMLYRIVKKLVLNKLTFATELSNVLIIFVELNYLWIDDIRNFCFVFLLDYFPNETFTCMHCRKFVSFQVSCIDDKSLEFSKMKQCFPIKVSM